MGRYRLYLILSQYFNVEGCIIFYRNIYIFLVNKMYKLNINMCVTFPLCFDFAVYAE